MRSVVYRGAVYREAGAYDAVAKKLLAPLWKWIAKLGLTKQAVLDFFNSLFDEVEKRRSGLKSVQRIELPEQLKALLLNFLAASKLERGPALLAIDSALDEPGPGWDWQTVGSLGEQVLVQTNVQGLAPLRNVPIARGEKFVDSVFISVWWAVEKPEGTANIALRGYIESHTGAVFWHAIGQDKYPKQTQFGGFVVVPRMEASSTGKDLCKLAQAAVTEGNSPRRFPAATLWKYYKLGAVSLNGVVEGREITNQDGIKLGVGGMSCADSVKFNHYITLPDVLMGRSQEFRSDATGAYQILLDELNTYSNQRTGNLADGNARPRTV